MGVFGLWKLIDSSGKEVPLDTLENKVLAIDISIWLHQVVKGFQDAKGNALPNAHLLGLYNRLCKLMYYRIKPIFVFDGGVPLLKLDTINKRKDSKNKIKNEADRIQNLLLNSLAKEKIVQQALGAASNILISPQKKASPQKKKEFSADDMFKLPPLPASQDKQQDDSLNSTTDSETSVDEQTEANYYRNLKSIDINSAHFKSLPSDIRYEILSEMKETRKHASWGMIQDLPTQNNEFSNFQMNRLLKRRRIQQSLEEAETEIGGKCLSMDILEHFVGGDDGLGVEQKQTAGGQFASDENRRFLFIRDLNKKIEKSKNDEELKVEKEEASASSLNLSDDEDDEELQKAIQMSLTVKSDNQEHKPEIVERVDENVNLNDLKFTDQQKKHLGGAASVLAKGFLMEYGGISADDFTELMERNANTPKKPKPHLEMIEKATNIEIIDIKDSQSDVTSDTDSDLVEVADVNDPELSDMKFFPVHYKSVDIPETLDLTKDFRIEDLKRTPIQVKPSTSGAAVEEKTNIKIDFKSLRTIDNLEDDIFADIFEEKSNIKSDESKHTKTNELREMPNNTIEVVSDTKKIDEIKHVNAIGSPKVQDILEELRKQKLAITSIDLDNIVTDVGLIKKTNDFDLKHLLNTDISEQQKLNIDDDGFDSDTTIIDTEYQNTKLEEKCKIETDIITIEDDSEKEILSQNDACIENKSSEIDFKTPSKVKPNEHATPTSITPSKLAPVFTQKTPPTTPSSTIIKPKSKSIEKMSLSQSPVQLSIPAELDASNKSDQKQSNLNPKNLMDEFQAAAAETLKSTHTKEDLENYATALYQEQEDLQRERNRQDRMGTSITQQMSEECKELLKLFGIPFIVAPMEAEAQCAFLNLIKLTDGTITDDSDIWLFGGQTVYKNFFNLKKNVLEYRMENIERLYKIDRKKMIQIALLVGSDYTTGISGIGAVTALEILASFPPEPEKVGETTEEMSILSSLRRFREWFRTKNSICTNHDKTILRGKLKNIEINQGFPYLNVVEAYLNPTVDGNAEKFSWGVVDDESIRDYTRKKFGWTRLKTDETLVPVLNRLSERKQQKAITSYFNLQCTPTDKNLKVSKRMRTAINKLGGNLGDDTELLETSPKKPKRKAKSKTVNINEANNEIIILSSQSSNIEENPCSSSNSTQSVNTDAVDVKKTRGRSKKSEAGSSELNSIPKTRNPRGKKATQNQPTNTTVSSTTNENVNDDDVFATEKVARKRRSNETGQVGNSKTRTPRIPNTKFPIPQREKDLKDIEENRLKAVEIFKKSKK